ncbi:hypothetical protein llap_10944 [Limosa lapponica baueri]|uniref:Uncharacterized protein n=1 Tax=Limosa lapponica baueri TaxID=1758121 RepID=A0A2I0TYA4_LIMLA|nr:hypothetical protein llap_10944 [Limosa lapponica baueri]
MDQLILDVISKHIEEQEVIGSGQHGFTKGDFQQHVGFGSTAVGVASRVCTDSGHRNDIDGDVTPRGSPARARQPDLPDDSKYIEDCGIYPKNMNLNSKRGAKPYKWLGDLVENIVCPTPPEMLHIPEPPLLAVTNQPRLGREQAALVTSPFYPQLLGGRMFRSPAASATPQIRMKRAVCSQTSLVDEKPFD